MVCVTALPCKTFSISIGRCTQNVSAFALPLWAFVLVGFCLDTVHYTHYSRLITECDGIFLLLIFSVNLQ